MCEGGLPTIIRPGNSNNLLFTEFSANKIASITTDGVVTESAEFLKSGPTGQSPLSVF
jgi:hypothetical protein